MHILHNTGQIELSNLTRTPQVQADYDKHRQQLASVGMKPSEYIIDHEFKSSKRLCCIARNTYPYNLPKEYTHWLAWFRPIQMRNKVFEISANKALEFIQYEFNMDQIVAIWENVPENRTIPDLKHYHFIVYEL